MLTRAAVGALAGLVLAAAPARAQSDTTDPFGGLTPPGISTTSPGGVSGSTGPATSTGTAVSTGTPAGVVPPGLPGQDVNPAAGGPSLTPGSVPQAPAGPQYQQPSGPQFQTPAGPQFQQPGVPFQQQGTSPPGLPRQQPPPGGTP